MINSHLRAGYHVLVVEIGVDAHDAHRVRGESRDELYHWVCPRDMTVDRILIGKHALRNTLRDDRDVLSADAIGLVEITSRNNGDAQSGEISWRDSAKVGSLVLFARIFDMTLGRELQARTEAARVTPR